MMKLFAPDRLQRSFHTVLENLILRRVNHGIDKVVDLRLPDAVEVVSDRHVENDAVRIAQVEFLRNDVNDEPGLDVLVQRLLHGQLCRPLAIVALIPHLDAGLRNTLRKLAAVHLLDRLKFKPG